MKKIVGVLCLFALLYVVYLVVVSQPQDQRPVSADTVDLEMNVDRARDKCEEYSSAVAAEVEEALGDAVRQADEKLSSVAAQADEAIEEAVGSAVEGAKKGFLNSMKKSITEFFQNLTS